MISLEELIMYNVFDQEEKEERVTEKFNELVAVVKRLEPQFNEFYFKNRKNNKYGCREFMKLVSDIYNGKRVGEVATTEYDVYGINYKILRTFPEFAKALKEYLDEED